MVSNVDGYGVVPGSGQARQKPLAYRPDVDGLRAIAVVSVVLFHLGLKAVPGGFVGVDVFFVISGFLITAIVVDECKAKSFTFSGFYVRRIRRIFPALFAMSFVCALAACALSTPTELRRFGQSLVAMSVFASNMFLRYTGASRGYFDHDSQSDALLHTWSLSVEEQFYIFLPPIIVWLVRSQRRLLPWLSTLCLVSLAASIVWTFLNQKEAFYFVFTRAWEFLIGSLLAMRREPVGGPLARGATGVCGLGLIAAAVFGFSSATLFPGAAAIVPCVGTGLIILAGQGGPHPVGRLLSTRPFVLVGVLSYSLYLWHWPIIIFAKRLTLNEIDEMTPAMLVSIALLSFCAAWLSYTFVERPFRKTGKGAKPSLVLSSGLAASAFAVVLGIGLIVGNGLMPSSGGRTAIAANIARLDDIPDNKCNTWKVDVHSIGDVRSCPLGSQQAKKILFWGDSHVDLLRSNVARLVRSGALGGRGVLYALALGCPPTVSIRPIEDGFHCNAVARIALDRALQPDIDTVFVGFGSWWDAGPDSSAGPTLCVSRNDKCLRSIPSREVEDRVLDALGEQLTFLKAHGKKAIVMLPWPHYSASVPKYQINRLRFAGWTDLLISAGWMTPPRRFDHVSLRTKAEAVAKAAGAVVYDPRPALCAGNDCRFERDGVSLYSDEDHIAESQTSIFDKGLMAAIAETEPTHAAPGAWAAERKSAEASIKP